MGGMKVLLRILLSLSVFIAGFGHAMPAEQIGIAESGSMSHSHCEEQGAQAMSGGAPEGLHGPSGHDTGQPHAKGGCCKSGSCPCPQVAVVMWDESRAMGPLGRHASDFATPRSDYRSPALERLIRPPIV